MSQNKSIENYQAYYDAYRTSLAQRRYDEALRNLDLAISACPVMEAIDFLAGRRVALVQEMTPIGEFLQRFFRGLFGRRE